MAKIRTLSALQDALDEDMSWRVREISELRIAAKSKTINEKIFVRAGVSLLYAHWEGFIKKSSECYLGYVNHQGVAYRDLKSCFSVFGMKRELSILVESKRSLANIEAFDFVRSKMEKPSNMSVSGAIDAESNLTSTIFSNIANSLDISTKPYESKFNLIDSSLVRRRNKIAHGEFLDIASGDFFKLIDEVLALMRQYKTDLQNAASTASYKRP